ncbi:MAG TPA: MerR family transcriptional regulator [Pelobium sp.]|nr:MerR family transcriptional regulator [Pelobium sp.]
MKHFSISDIESLTGIKAHTLRIWEQRYDIFIPKRTETNIRYYDDDDLCLFLNIATLNENGYKISKISKMDSAEIVSAVKAIQANHKNANAQIQTLCNAMIKMDELEFESIINHCINDIGLEESMTEILFPFLYKVGEMWQVGTINPAHEHFATHKIEQKIIEATYKLEVKTTVKSKKYVLFLPPEEQHELGLLFAQYLLRKHGQHCLYLGQNLPFETLREVVAYYYPDFAFTALTTSLLNTKIETTLNSLVEVLAGTPLFVTGNQVINCTQPNTSKLRVIKNIESFIEQIKN